MVMAMDVGGSNVRVTKYKLMGNGAIEVIKEVRRSFPEEYMQGTADQVFGFLADCVMDTNPEPDIKFGFTFSFPCEQTTINSAKLLIWTKGFSASGCVGKDPARLLEDALKARGLSLHVNAICNDTVGTLLSRSYGDPTAAVGIILGTGCNAAYIENVERITKAAVPSHSGKMIINMECGATGDRHPELLPQLPFDRAIDLISPNPGYQHLEKMMSGMYLGELSRRWAVDLYQKGQLFANEKSDCTFLSKDLCFDAKYCSMILGDTTTNLEEVDRILHQFQVVHSTLEDRKTVKHIVHYIVRRSARLMASFIHAIYTHMGEDFDHCSVGVDGSVYKYTPNYQEWVFEALHELGRGDIRIGFANDGSCIGAALIAHRA